MKRQGDLLIVKVGSIPQGAIKRDDLVLAEGEATGHLHELDSGEVYEKAGTLYFKVSEEETVKLVHPEHESIMFESGKYEVIRQREYRPKGWIYVTD